MQQVEHGSKSLGSTEPLICSADLTGKSNHLAKLVTGGLALTNNAFDRICGLIINGAASGQRGDLRPWIAGGFYRVKVSAAVADKAYLQLDTANPGQLVTQTTGQAVAQAVEAAADAGQIISVQALVCAGVESPQWAPTAANATATLTANALITGIITSTGATGPTLLTLPLGTALDTALPAMRVGGSLEFTIINTGTGAANDVTLVANTGVTIIGNPTVGALTDGTIIQGSGRFQLKKTGTATYEVYRLS